MAFFNIGCDLFGESDEDTLVNSTHDAINVYMDLIDDNGNYRPNHIPADRYSPITEDISDGELNI